jgi:hypothetical protein
MGYAKVMLLQDFFFRLERFPVMPSSSFSKKTGLLIAFSAMPSSVTPQV